VHVRPIVLPEASDTRVFLLRSGPGTKMLQHTHTGVEMTCVLSGAFRHDGGHYGPGDFDLGDETVDHLPIVDADADCVCLVAMQGKLRLNGLIGRLIQPFVRL
jgi:putative transcriptional regulator